MIWAGWLHKSSLLQGMSASLLLLPVIQYSLMMKAIQAGMQLQVVALKEEIVNESIEYPSYYQQHFHAYEEGNLGWLPAFEAEPATDVMAVRAIGDASLSPAHAQHRLRTNIHNAIQVAYGLH